MKLTLEQVIEKIDANTKVVCDIEYEKQKLSDLLMGLLSYGFITVETYQQAMNYVFVKKVWYAYA